MSNISLDERRKWIGASESAALLGLSPFVSRFELWHQKAGNIAPHDLSDNERVMAGQFMEPSIAAWAAHKWGWDIKNVREYRESTRVRGMGCSLDFETLASEPVEIKNVDRSVFRDPQGEWQSEGDEIVDAPVYYMVQVQHQIACPPPGWEPAERGWLVVCVGGNQLYRMPIERHDGIIARLEHEIAAFWQSIMDGSEPTPDFSIDAATIGMLYGGRAEDCADLRGNDRARRLCETYVDAVAIEREAKRQKEASLAELKMMMNDAKFALVDGGYKISASHMKESTIERKGHWRFRVTAPKETA